MWLAASKSRGKGLSKYEEGEMVLCGQYWLVQVLVVPGAGTEADGTHGAMGEGDKTKVVSVCQVACISLSSC